MYLWDLDDGGFAGVVVLKKGMLVPFLLSIHDFNYILYC